MCAGCEAVYQTATSNPSLITMIVGYVSAGILLAMSYMVFFIKNLPQKLKNTLKKGLSICLKSTKNNML